MQDVDLKLGPIYGTMLIGAILAAIFFGISTTQAYFYYITFDDSRATKFYVAALWTCDAMSIALTFHGLYYYLVANYANVSVIPMIVWSLSLESMFTFTTIFISHCFFIHRIWIVSKMHAVCAIIVIGAISGYVLGLALTIIALKVGKWEALGLHSTLVIFTSNKVMETLTDVVVTITLVFVLHNQKTRWTKTHYRLRRLIFFLVNRGAFAAFLQTCYLITFLIWRDLLIWVPFHVALGKVYTNSVIAVLNSRASTQLAEDSQAYDATGNATSLSSSIRVRARGLHTVTKLANLSSPQSDLEYEMGKVANAGEGGSSIQS